jgi:hypothetical protein
LLQRTVCLLLVSAASGDQSVQQASCDSVNRRKATAEQTRELEYESLDPATREKQVDTYQTPLPAAQRIVRNVV